MKKQVYQQKYFSVITKNSNWEILRKNLLTFKSKMVLRMKNFNILEVPGKIWLLGGRSRKVNIEGGGVPKKGGLESLPI